MTREKTDMKADFLQPWTPPTHIIMYGRYMDKHQKLSKSIGTPILDTDKILQFIVKIYASKYFTEEHMMTYECQSNNKKDDWHETLQYFTNLYVIRKMYSEERAGNSGFKSSASFKEATSRTQTMYPWIIAMPTGADSVNTPVDYNEYV